MSAIDFLGSFIASVFCGCCIYMIWCAYTIPEDRSHVRDSNKLR